MLRVAATRSECALGTTPLMIVSLHQDSGVSRKWMEGAQEGDFRLLSAGD